MEKHFNHNGSSASPQIEPDIAALMKKIQQHLMFLEKKIDTLISRSPGKPSGGQHFSKPFRPYGHSNYRGKGKHYNGSREGGGDQGRRFDRGQGGGNRRFNQGEKPFFHRRKRHA